MLGERHSKIKERRFKRNFVPFASIMSYVQVGFVPFQKCFLQFLFMPWLNNFSKENERKIHFTIKGKTRCDLHMDFFYFWLLMAKIAIEACTQSTRQMNKNSMRRRREKKIFGENICKRRTLVNTCCEHRRKMEYQTGSKL